MNGSAGDHSDALTQLRKSEENLNSLGGERKSPCIIPSLPFLFLGTSDLYSLKHREYY